MTGYANVLNVAQEYREAIMSANLSERDGAVLLANRLLDEPYADPDDDLRVLARQLIRRTEEVAALKDRVERAEETLRRIREASVRGFSS